MAQRRILAESNIASGEGSISVAMAKSISAPKEPSLFDDLSEEEKKQWLPTKAGTSGDDYITRETPVYLTNKESKVVMALASLLSKDIGAEDIANHLEDLNRLEIKGTTEKGSLLSSRKVLSMAINRPRKPKINREVNIIELTKKINGGTARIREIEETGKLLQNIADRVQVLKFSKNGIAGEIHQTLISIDKNDSIYLYAVNNGGKKGTTFQSEAPEDGSRKKVLVKENITFNNLFFMQLDTRYAPIPPRLFGIWGKAKGTNTELFPKLLNLLLANYSERLNRAQKAKKRVEAEFKELRINTKGKNKKALQEKIEHAQKLALTISLTGQEVRDLVSTDYNADNKAKKALLNDLSNIIEALKDCNLITEGRIYTNRDNRGNILERLELLYNVNYFKRESITLPEETKEEEAK